MMKVMVMAAPPAGDEKRNLDTDRLIHNALSSLGEGMGEALDGHAREDVLLVLVDGGSGKLQDMDNRIKESLEIS